MDPTYPLVPIANFLACILVLIPLLCTSIRSGSWNVAVTAFALWTGAYSILRAVNAIIWSNNDKDVAPLWCDIVTHFEVAADFAPRACTFVLTRYLYNITSCRNLAHRNRRKLVADLAWTVGLPLLMIPFYAIVQDSRYMILEEEGCVSVSITLGLEILLLDIPLVILPLISATFYCPRIIMAVYKLWKNSNEFSLVVDQQLTSSTTGIYFRVLILGCIDVALALPSGMVPLVVDLIPPPSVFYPGWTEVSAKMQSVTAVPASSWRSQPFVSFSIYYNLWVNPVLACVFFALFGLTSEARATYRHIFRKAMRPLWVIQPKSSLGTPRILSEMKFGRFGSTENRAGHVSHTLATGTHASADTEHSKSNSNPPRTESGSAFGEPFNMAPGAEEGSSAAPEGDRYV